MNGSSLELGLTHKDVIGARAYVNYRLLLNTRNACLRDAPHIFSHTILTIEGATDDTYSDRKGDYVYENHFVNRALKTEWVFNENGCTTSSCFPTYPLSETCRKSNAPLSFGLPDGKRMDACQPACFNSRSSSTSVENVAAARNPKDATRHLPPQLIWSDGACLLENYALTSFFVDPSKRHDNGKIDEANFDIYVAKLGADRNPVICARINPEYCRSFYMDFVRDYDEKSSPEDKTCGYDGATYYLQLFIGSSLIKLARLSAKTLAKGIEEVKRKMSIEGRFAKDAPVFLRRGPPTRDFLKSVKSWKNNVDRSKKFVSDDVTLAELGLDDERVRDRLVWTDEFSHLDDGRNDSYGGRLIEKRRGIPTSVSNNDNGDDVGKRDIDKNPNEGISKKIVRDVLMPNSKRVTRHLNETKNDDRLSENKLVDVMEKVILGMGAMLSKEQMSETFLQFGVDGGSTVLKHFLKTTGPRLINAFLKSELLAAGKTISAKLLSAVISHAAINLIVENVALQFGRVAIALMGVASSALTIIGWILLIGPIMDLLFTFVWDPFEFSVPTLSDALLRKISESALMQRQIEFGSRRIEMRPDTFWRLHVIPGSRENLYENDRAACVLKHTLIYFSNRRISSDGSSIDWTSDDAGDTTTASLAAMGEEYDVRAVFRQLIVRNMMISYRDVKFYQRSIEERATFTNYVIMGALIAFLPTVYITKRAGIYAILVIFLVIVNCASVLCMQRVFANGKPGAKRNGRAPSKV